MTRFSRGSAKFNASSSTRVREHLNLADPRENSALKQRIILRNSSSNIRYDLNSFRVLKQCKSDFYAKIHEAF